MSGVTNEMLNKLLVQAKSSGPQFEGENFRNALSYLFNMCCSDDKAFVVQLQGVSNILAGAEKLGIIYKVVSGGVVLDPTCTLSVGLMKMAVSMCQFLTIVLVREKNLMHSEVQKPVPKVEKKSQECWCVVNGKPVANASTGHRCGFQDGKMGVTIMIDGQIETHPVPCSYKNNCQTKNCIFEH